MVVVVEADFFFLRCFLLDGALAFPARSKALVVVEGDFNRVKEKKRL